MENFVLKLREAVEASIEYALSRQEGPAKREAAVADEAWKDVAALKEDWIWTLGS